MKIAVFTDSFFPSQGGTERATYNLCKEFIRLGHDIILFAPDYHREQSFDEFKVVRVRSIKLTDSDNAVLVGLEYRRISKIVREFAPDVLYFCSASGMAKCAIKLKKELHVPVAATIHTKFKEAFYDSCKSRLITAVLIRSLVGKLNRTDKVMTVCNDMKNELRSYGYLGETTVILNGTDHIASAPVSCGEERRDGVFRFLFCGRLVKIKNIQFSIRCLAYLKREMGFNDFKFILVGSGNYEKKLKRLVKREGLEENVEFKGFVSDREELDRIYKSADLFLFPSTFDNDGLVICEAAQQGTPTLTFSDCGSAERIENNKNGFLSARDVESFARRIYEIANDRKLLEQVRANVHSLKGESWHGVAHQYETVFKDLIGGGYSLISSNGVGSLTRQRRRVARNMAGNKNVH